MKVKTVKHRRPERITDSSRAAVAAAVKRITFFFVEGCVESLINIRQAEKDAADDEDVMLSQDINHLMVNMGLREESRE